MRYFFKAVLLTVLWTGLGSVGRGQIFDNTCPSGTTPVIPLRTQVQATGHLNDTMCYDANGNLIFQALGASLSTSDTFTRANGALGINWNTGIVAPTIQTNAAGGASGQYSIAGWKDTTYVSNSQFAQATIAVVGVGEAGPAVFVSSNVSASSNGVGYFCGEGTTSITLYRTSGSVTTSLGTSAITGANGDVIRLEITSAGSLTCYRNGVSTLTASDTTYKGGSPGIILRGAAGTPSTLNNWSGGNLPVSQGTGPTFGKLSCKNFEAMRCVDGANTQGWAGATISNWIDSAIADCSLVSCIVSIAADAPAGNSALYSVTQDGIATTQTPAYVTLIDNRTASTSYTNIMFNGVPSSDPAMLTVYNHLVSPPHTSGAVFTTSQVTGTTPADGGTVSSLTSEMDINGTLTSVAGASKVVAIEGYAAIRSLGQTIADVRGGTFSVNLDRAPSTTNVTDASSLFASPCRNLSSTATIVNCYSFQAQQPTLGTSRNYSAFFNGSVLMPNNVNFDVVNSSGTAARFLTFNVDNTTAFRPRGTDQAGDFQFTDTTATIPIMTLGTSGGVVLAGVCINGPSYRWHVECATAGDIIAKFRNTSATGFGIVVEPGSDNRYGIAVANAANTLNTFAVLGGGGVQYAETTAPAGTAGLDVCYADSTAHTRKCSDNNGTFFNESLLVYSSNGTQETGAPHIVQDTATLAAGTVTVTLTGNAVFTNATSYTCVADDDTAIAATKVLQNSGSSITITGTGTDVVRFICVGN